MSNDGVGNWRHRTEARWRGAVIAFLCAQLAFHGSHRAFAQAPTGDPSPAVVDERPFEPPADKEPMGPVGPSAVPLQLLAPTDMDTESGWYEGVVGPGIDASLAGPGWSDPSSCPPGYYLPCLTPLGLRHSYTNGRNVGLGGPLVSTSWLNRPYFVGVELGTIWIMRSVEDSVSRDTDAFGGLFFGWDWDHYWGGELRFDWATPELVNSAQPDAPRGDSLFAWSYNQMYYPWGDATVRPYWRWGIGNTKFDFPMDDGSRRDEWLLTFPIGVGVKYPVRRWLAARAELADQLSVGNNGLPTMHNLTLTVGVECRFGARPKSYWPWNPSRKIR